MKEAGRVVEQTLNYLKEEGCVKIEDLKDKIGIEEKKKGALIDFLLTLKLIKIERNDQIMITGSGLEFLGL
jgi:predicted transcriptional regulator